MKTLLIVAAVVFSGSKLGFIAFDSAVKTGKQQSVISSERRVLDKY